MSLIILHCMFISEMKREEKSADSISKTNVRWVIFD